MDNATYAGEQMNSFSFEAELIPPVKEYYEQKGFTVFHEVHIGFCRADLVACNDETVVAIELKLADWKKALIQAKNYQLAAEYVYLAFPSKKIDLVRKKATVQLNQEGIGLLSVDERDHFITVELKADKSKKIFAVLNQQEIIKRREKSNHRRLLRFF